VSNDLDVVTDHHHENIHNQETTQIVVAKFTNLLSQAFEVQVPILQIFLLQ
jgi:hypothetical protein